MKEDIVLSMDYRDIKLLNNALGELFTQLDDDDLTPIQHELLYDDTQRINNIIEQLPQTD